MDRIWLNSYPQGIPPKIDLGEYSSINDVFARSCRRFAERPAFHNLGKTVTYAGLDLLSRDFAAYLQTLGLRKGSRVALMMPNVLQYPVALFGALRAGMIVVNVNPLYTARELQHQLADSGAEAIVVLENFAHVLEQALPQTQIKHVILTQLGDLLPAPKRLAVNFAVKHVKKMIPKWRIPHATWFRAALRRGSRAALDEASPGRDDIALLQYTGGTTGASKGAVLTHGNLVANLLQATAWSKTVLQEGGEIVVTALPLYHIFSFTTNCLLFMKLGGMNLLITNPKDMPAFVAELRRSRFTSITGVNTLFNGLLNTPGFAQIDFSHLKLALAGGAALHRTVAERWLAVTGHPVVEGYGLTEASPFVSCNPVNAGYTGSIGLPLPSTDLVILDENGRELPAGAEGEICVRGPQVMSGYWQQPSETMNVLTSEGWLRTGDIGVMDPSGYVRITDRKKDMILVSGFNVYPNEIENVISSVPGVLECGVVGVPDPVTGEAVRAFVVCEDPNLTADAIAGYCRQQLTKYKVPKAIEFRSELPKTPVGKILRRELRVIALQSVKAEPAQPPVAVGRQQG